jgi:hypothetical protein
VFTGIELVSCLVQTVPGWQQAIRNLGDR